MASQITNINQLEEIVKAYLSNPVLRWSTTDIPYILTATEYPNFLDTVKPLEGDETIVIRADVDSVLYESIETFSGTHIIASLYNLYLRASMTGIIDEAEEVVDHALKNITSDIIRFMTTYSGFDICQEAYMRRLTPNNLSNNDPTNPVFDTDC